MVKKIRPKAEAAWSEGNDGRDAHYYIKYSCPTCNRRISGFKSSDACDQCGTFYDWSGKPEIITTVSVRWR